MMTDIYSNINLGNDQLFTRNLYFYVLKDSDFLIYVSMVLSDYQKDKYKILTSKGTIRDQNANVNCINPYKHNVT